MSRLEAIDSSTKETLKLCIEAGSIGLNCIALATSPADSIALVPSKAIAAGVHFLSLAEKFYPSLKGNRQVFAVNPYETYHIAHVTNFIINAAALVYFAYMSANPVTLCVLGANVALSRPVLHWGNSLVGHLMHRGAAVKA